MGTTKDKEAPDSSSDPGTGDQAVEKFDLVGHPAALCEIVRTKEKSPNRQLCAYGIENGLERCCRVGFVEQKSGR